jgi:rubrerythrin
MSADATRRALLGRGLVVVRAHGDVQVLRALIALEQLIVLGYERQLSAGVLGARARRMVRSFLAHEQEHVAALSVELQRLGGALPEPPARASVGTPASRNDALAALVAIENDALGSYYRALGKLHDPQAALVAAQIMASEGQHVAALTGLLEPGQPRLITPSAFLYGT